MNDPKILIEKYIDEMLSAQRGERVKTYVAQYKGNNLILQSGKCSWRKIGHAKSAIRNHFAGEESNYVYYPDGKYDASGKLNQINTNGAHGRYQEFRKKLFELIEIVELKN